MRRAQLLPDGGFVDRDRLADYSARLAKAIGEAAAVKGAFARTDEAAELWATEYPRLVAEVPGLLGTATSRAEAQVLRLSLIYAALDGRVVVDVEHLQSALAVWEYCFESAAYLFGHSTGDDVADRILDGLRRRPEGMTRTEIRELVGGRHTEARIELALELLARYGLAEMERETETGGRPAERWRATRTPE